MIVEDYAGRKDGDPDYTGEKTTPTQADIRSREDMAREARERGGI
jgi:hypothetical protein